ncbi:type II toxin-antitoxin system VapB family antitoxin [Mumia sp. Pv 4-285]|uniref:type II toxin-antitoxin system VapB family antitoxin n=1 Tax=Mumia qirimensis TaxID=3234852 RepID=UPI00351D3247
MSLNIKNERTHALVRRLAELSGTSQTAAVDDAVRRRLAELESSVPARRSVDAMRVDRLLVEFRRDLTDDDREAMRRADETLYDEQGLPQ